MSSSSRNGTVVRVLAADYRRRIVDDELDELVAALRAIAVEGQGGREDRNGLAARDHDPRTR